MPAPLQPDLLHGRYVAAVLGVHRVGAGDFVQCLEPVSSRGLHPGQDQGHGGLAHAYDFPVSRMLGRPAGVGEEHRFTLPSVRQFVETVGACWFCTFKFLWIVLLHSWSSMGVYIPASGAVVFLYYICARFVVGLRADHPFLVWNICGFGVRLSLTAMNPSPVNCV